VRVWAGSADVEEQAERVSLRVEHHPHILLWLMVGTLRSDLHRPLHAGIEVLHTKVKVDPHELFAIDWGHVGDT